MNLNEYKVLSVLNREGRAVFFRDLSKKAKVSIGGTQQVLKNYSGYLNKEVSGRNTYYSLRNDVKTFYLKKILEIFSTKEFLVKNQMFSEFFDYFVRKGIPCLIFGSYARGDFGKRSDLDVLVLSSVEIPEHLCPVEIHLIRLSKKDFEKAVKAGENLIKEISKNHLIVEGFDYFGRWLNEKN